jgi:S-adenosylmethionine/arginine decarboxylase-like enzyme
MTNKPFGYSYLLDMYRCRKGAADDMELTYRFLERLVDEIKMTRMSAPIVIHGPTENGKELYPEKAGVSGWVPLIESGIQIHSLEPSRFITLDVYSCNKFDKDIVLQFAKKYFEFEEYQEHYVVRGSKFSE